mgnify:CR=1 FL=1
MRVEVSQRSVPTYYVRGTFAAPSIANPDYPAAMVATNILSQQFFDEVRVPAELSDQAKEALTEAGVPVLELEVERGRLSDAFLEMTS